jgi:hypothetical protein
MKIEIGHWYIVNKNRRVLVYVYAHSQNLGLYRAYSYYLPGDNNVSSTTGLWSKSFFKENGKMIQHLGEYSIKEFIETFPEYYGIYNIEDLGD